ncbi:MAG: tripartite tricarboxylate transporter permease [Alphaproteobacteria bacterium]
MALGVMMGLVLGIIPGIGGLVGMALLLPFTFDMDPYAAFAMLLGMSAVTSTSDTIPAVLFGVPGTSSSQATVLDGLQMAKKGEAGRALSAAYTASLIGGIFGALLLGLTIPLLRPVMLYIGSPELLGFAIFGISMVASLSGSAPLRGLAAAGFGMMLAMIGSDPQTGTLRWTLDSLYLWDGLPLVPMVLGLFALPELADLMIQRTAISAGGSKYDVRAGMWLGMKDAFRHWWLVIRCGALGSLIGAIPGLGSSVVDWIAYGHALQTEKGAQKTFGTGDVRGVIAPESANNSITGGALVPTVAFGVPGSASMAILLGAFLIHGLVPGPDMLTKNLHVTYSMVWSIAVANILGAGLCFMFSGQFAKLALLRYTLILPGVLAIMYLGSFQASRQWGDLYTLMIFGVLGWSMKHLKWPRPPLILGVVLGDIIERYMFISIERYQADWLLRPVVIAMLVLSALTLLRPFLQDVRAQGGFKPMIFNFTTPKFQLSSLFYVFFISLIAFMLWQASKWNYDARIAPDIVGGLALVAASISFFYHLCRRPGTKHALGIGEKAQEEIQQKLHMDTATDHSSLSKKTVLLRAGIFFAYTVGFMISMAIIGLLPTIPLFVVAFMRIEAREPWKLVLPQAVVMTLAIWLLFDKLLTIPWPQTYIADWFPFLKGLIPSV